MDYRTYRPSEALRDFVQCYWTLEGIGHDTQIIYPDGCMELVFHYGDCFERLHGDGSAELQARGLLVGQMRRFTRVRPNGLAGCFGVRFWPGGALAGIPARELTGEIWDIGAVHGDWLERRMLACETTAERIGVIEKFLLPQRRPAWNVSGVAGHIRESGGCVNVRRLADSAGLSVRQFERRFEAAVGLSPKLFSRIVRFQRALELAGRNETSASVAAECGYYDQSHLIRDFRKFAGVTPGPGMSLFSNTATPQMP